MSAQAQRTAAGGTEPPRKLLKQWLALLALSRDRSLSAGHVAVWIRIADHCNAQGIAFPGMELLAKETGLSYRSVVRAVGKLEDAGYVEVVRRGTFGRSNTYRLTYKGSDSNVPVTHVTPVVHDTPVGGDALTPSDSLQDKAVSPRLPPVSPYPTHEPEHEARVHGSDFILPSDAAGTAPAWAGLPSASASREVEEDAPREGYLSVAKALTASQEACKEHAKGVVASSMPRMPELPEGALNPTASSATIVPGANSRSTRSLAARGDAMYDALVFAMVDGDLSSTRWQAAREIVLLAESEQIIKPPTDAQRSIAVAQILEALNWDEIPEGSAAYDAVFRNEELVRMLEEGEPYLNGNGAKIAERERLEKEANDRANIVRREAMIRTGVTPLRIGPSSPTASHVPLLIGASRTPSSDFPARGAGI